MKKLTIPKYAKEKASSALTLRKNLPKSKKFGLTKEQAGKLGITSGVARAKQIVRSKTLTFQDAKAVCKFKRFVPAKTMKEQGAVDLWGGERFIKKACAHVQKVKRRSE